MIKRIDWRNIELWTEYKLQNYDVQNIIVVGLLGLSAVNVLLFPDLLCTIYHILLWMRIMSPLQLDRAGKRESRAEPELLEE